MLPPTPGNKYMKTTRPPAYCHSSAQRFERQRGSNIVEFAIVVPFFLMIMLGVIEMSMMYFADLTMQHAVREGARYAVTGQNNLDPNTSNQQRYQAVLQKIKDSSMGMYSRVSPVISVNGSSSTNASMFGEAGDIVVISIACTWKFTTPIVSAFFKDGKMNFVVAATMRNESYGGL